MSKRSRWISLPALGVLAVVAVGPATAAKVTNVKSTVTIKSGEGTEFTGKVTSTQKACRRARKVKLVMEPYSGGKDEVVDTAKTDATGAWEMQGSYMAGIYHAEVTSTFVHTDSGTLHCLIAIGVSHRY